MAAQLLVHEDEDIMLITDDGTIIRMPDSDISTIGRVSQGGMHKCLSYHVNVIIVLP